MRKRGQAAMEFLMTYGWAILVVLVVIGALAYFGVLNPQSFLPKRCQISTGLVCEDHVFSLSSPAQIVLNNGLGTTIAVNDLTVTADDGTYVCSCDAASCDGSSLPAGQSKTFSLTCGTVDPGLSAGTRIKGSISVVYEDKQSGLSHTQPGTFLTDLEP